LSRLAALLLALVGTTAAVRAEPLVMVIDSGTEMPMAMFNRDRVVDGMSLELGRLLARQLGRELSALAVPRKRLVDSLLQGQADFSCPYMPAWLPGALQWSKPFFLQEDVIISRAEGPAPKQLQDLRGQAIGTVLGFIYPELSAALGTGFVRADAVDAAANLRLLAAGRIQHVSVAMRQLAHLRATGQFSAAIHPPLLMSSLRTHCALAPQARITLAQLDQAIQAIERDGSLAALYRRYELPSTRSSSRP
jgi:ABC-type amino acid transport substrate-binding protein